MLISDKTEFKTKAIIWDKERHYVMIKGSIQQENIILVNNEAPNMGAPKHTKQTWMDMKGEINRNSVMVGEFNTPLMSMDRYSGQKNFLFFHQ